MANSNRRTPKSTPSKTYQKHSIGSSPASTSDVSSSPRNRNARFPRQIEKVGGDRLRKVALWTLRAVTDVTPVKAVDDRSQL